MPKYVLGIDPGLANCAGVLLEEGKPVCHFALRTDPIYGLEERYHLVSEAVLKLARDADLVALENQAFGARMPDTRPAEVAGVIRYRLWVERIPFVLVSPSTAKKHATGNGRAKKPEMIAAAVADGFLEAQKNEHLADAYWVARTAEVLHGQAKAS